MMYALYAVIKAVVKKRDGAVIFISGILLLFLTVVNDVLDEAQIINSPALLPVGLFMFLFTQVIYLSVRYSRTFAYTEKLSADLAIINKNLENIVDDRTKEIKNKNQELIELSGFKHDMINMLAHDLKNSLHIIINLAANKKVKYAGYVMHNLIMNFLDINKSEETHLQLTKSQSSLKRMVTNAILQTKLFAEQKSVVITNKVLQDIQILVDKELMLRVFVNLITNAIKYSPVGNEVLIESCIVKIDNTQSVEISIIDYGEGISDDKKDKVFDKYFSDGKKSGTIRSTGLGLAFCKMAIEAHNSSILVDSHKGKFTKFYFVLPVLSVKNDNDDQSVQNINSSQIRFDAAELEYLKPISKQLFLCKIYQASELRRILNAITDSEFENIRLWKHHLEKAIYNYNSNDFEFLLNTLKQQLDYA